MAFATTCRKNAGIRSAQAQSQNSLPRSLVRRVHWSDQQGHHQRPGRFQVHSASRNPRLHQSKQSAQRQKEVGISTILNALSPLARQLEAAFGIKLLVNRQEETIKLLSEAWTANMFATLRKDHERLFKRYNDNMQFAERVGVDLSKVIAGSEMERTQKILTGRQLDGSHNHPGIGSGPAHAGLPNDRRRATAARSD